MGGRPGAFLFSLLMASCLAFADSAPSSNPNGTYGSVTLAANTATAVPASPMAGRYAISIQNLDSNPIYCGFDSSVTASNGTQIAASGQVSFQVSYDANLGRAIVWCLSAAGTTSGAIRWMEVR
jgi:hypothetical protein